MNNLSFPESWGSHFFRRKWRIIWTIKFTEAIFVSFSWESPERSLQKEWPYFWHQKSCAFHIDIVVRLARFFGAFLLAGTDAQPPARPFRDSNFKWKAEEPLKKLMDFCPPLLPRQKHPKVFELKNRDCPFLLYFFFTCSYNIYMDHCFYWRVEAQKIEDKEVPGITKRFYIYIYLHIYTQRFNTYIYICIYFHNYTYIYIHIPRTQMTLVLIEKVLVLKGWPSKIEVSWVLGTYIYILYIHVHPRSFRCFEYRRKRSKKLNFYRKKRAKIPFFASRSCGQPPGGCPVPWWWSSSGGSNSVGKKIPPKQSVEEIVEVLGVLDFLVG